MTRRRPSLSASAVLTLVLGLAGTATVFGVVRGHELREIELDFSQRANVRIAGVRQGLSGAIDAMQAVNRLFATVDTVDREQFRAFTEPLLERYPYIQAFNFHRVVRGEEFAAYEAAMRARFPDFRVHENDDGRLVPARPKARHFIVDYIEPMRGNERAFGLDVASNPDIMETVARAVDSGRPQASELLRLAQGDGPRGGFLVIMPVYRRGAPLHDIAARREAFIGDTAAVFKVGHLVEKIFESGGFLNRAGIGISVYAWPQPDESHLVFRYGTAGGKPGPAGVWRWLRHDGIPHVERNFDVAGKTWTIVVAAEPALFDRGRSTSLAALAMGLLATLFATAWVQTATARSRRIQQLVDLRTAELQRANALLVDEIAARRRAEDALRLRERAIESSANPIAILRAEAPDYPYDYVNPAFERVTGYAAADVAGKPFQTVQTDYRDQPGIEEIRAAMRACQECHATLRSYRKDGTMFWNDIHIAPVRGMDERVTHFVINQYDITATKRYEAELEYQANRDVLTGLANRNLLRDRLGQAIAYASRYGHAVWVVFIDLDRFKFVNDTLGHRAGDALLNKVAERLLASVRGTDTVARLSGDDFVLILPERREEHLSLRAVQRILQTVAEPMSIEGHQFYPTCSAGVAAFPADGEDGDTLVKHAEIAMYRAKESGRNNTQFYTPEMNAEALERLKIEGSLRTAVERGEFVLHYQPQVDLRTGLVTGVESLIRWRHPEMGMVPPGRFIGLAEETGLIVPMGAWAIRAACAQAREWQRQGLGPLRVAVNLSARQFYQQDLVSTVAAALRDAGLAPRLLEIELTESLVMTDVERAIAVLRDLHALGVQIAIDDFGTGYSSLSYLKRFPIHVLKIDQSFVRDITDDADDAAIVLSVISLAHALRLQVIAEGVETRDQLAYLRQHGCDHMQGYYFSRPLPATELEQLLQQGKTLADVESAPAAGAGPA